MDSFWLSYPITVKTSSPVGFYVADITVVKRGLFTALRASVWCCPDNGAFNCPGIRSVSGKIHIPPPLLDGYGVYLEVGQGFLFLHHTPQNLK
jgi:hypothetical protein